MTASRSALALPRLNLSVAPLAIVRPVPAKLAFCCRLKALIAPSVMSKVLPPRFKVAPAVPAAVVPALRVVVLPGWTARVPVPVNEMAVFASEPPVSCSVPWLMTVPPV